MNILSLVILIIEVPGIIFHISVLVVLIRRILRKDETFRHGFFILYIASSLGDCAYVINKEVLFGLPLMGFLPGFYSSCASVCATFIFSFSMTSATFQNMLHAVIAFNRFTAFFWPQRHVRFWRGRNLTAILLVVCGFSLAVSVPSAFFPANYLLDENTKVVRGLASDEHVGQITSWVNLVTKVFFALCGFAFSLASALRLRSLIKTEQLGNFSGNQDVRLLAHSMFMVFAQLLGVAYLAMIQINDAFFESRSFVAFTQVYSSVVACFYCLSNPVFLLILSENVRRAYAVFYRIKPRDDSVIHVKATITPVNGQPQSTA